MVFKVGNVLLNPFETAADDDHFDISFKILTGEWNNFTDLLTGWMVVCLTCQFGVKTTFIQVNVRTVPSVCTGLRCAYPIRIGATVSPTALTTATKCTVVRQN